MTFSSPVWLGVGAVVVTALAVGAMAFSRRRARALAAAGVDPPTGRRRVQVGLWSSIAATAVLAFAAAGPTASVPVAHAAGTVILAMDVSNSMGADDVAPTRLAAAKKVARGFVQAQPDSVDVGVVAFDQGALVTSRPSSDHTTAQAAIDRLSVTGGTSLADAILGSLAAITGRNVTLGRDGSAPDLGYWGSATIVLVSDGQDQGDADRTQAAATVAEDAGVHIETVGVGTVAGTSVDVDGYRIHTALDQDTLTAIAKTSGGSYHPASDAAQLDGVASTIDLRLTVHDEDVPLAGAVTVVALLLLALGSILTVLRTGRIV